MRKRIKLLYVVVIAFVIVAGGLMTLNRLDQEIAVKDTESYIRKMARKDNRFLMPGEIRFVVVNPEALYAPGEMPGLEIEAETSETEPEAEPVQEDTEG